MSAPGSSSKWGIWIWAGLTLAYNTPWGWVVQDRIAEAVSDWWRVVRVNLMPGLIATIIDWFTMLANWIERQLYAVDEWLRFRGGDSHGSLALKAVLGLLWFPIAYIFRFVFYLLVEPQVNPVKHFPVVTVSHKVIWPMVPQLAETTGDLGGDGQHVRQRRSGHLRVHRLGVEGELAALSGEPAGGGCGRSSRFARGIDARVAPAGVPLGHDAQTVPQTAACEHASGPPGCITTSTTPRRASTASSSAELIDLLARSPDWGTLRPSVRGSLRLSAVMVWNWRRRTWALIPLRSLSRMSVGDRGDGRAGRLGG